MSVEKAELRAAAIHDAGARVDDLLEASRVAMFRAEGSASALQQSVEIVRQLHAHVDREIEAGTLDLERAAVAKQWVTNAVVILEQLSRNAAASCSTQRGHSAGIEAAVDLLKRLYVQEKAQGQQHEQRAALEPAEAPRQRGGIKSRRNSEAPAPSRSGAPRRRRASNGASASAARVPEKLDDGSDA